jgi:hypothetical protein
MTGTSYEKVPRGTWTRPRKKSHVGRGLETDLPWTGSSARPVDANGAAGVSDGECVRMKDESPTWDVKFLRDQEKSHVGFLTEVLSWLEVKKSEKRFLRS